MHWIIKWCAGILALITVIPALIVHKQSQHGYINTFFKSQLTTRTEEEFFQVENTFDKLEIK